MLNNPFCYTPSPSIVEAALALAKHIDETPELRALFAEGKMLGILEVEADTMRSLCCSGNFLYAFSDQRKNRVGKRDS